MWSTSFGPLASGAAHLKRSRDRNSEPFGHLKQEARPVLSYNHEFEFVQPQGRNPLSGLLNCRGSFKRMEACDLASAG